MQVNLLYKPSQTLAQIWLAPGESVVADSGAMVGMSTNVVVETQAGGIMSLVYALGMVVILFAPDTSRRKLSE